MGSMARCGIGAYSVDDVDAEHARLLADQVATHAWDAAARVRPDGHAWG
jgi:hypothetical protein